MPIPTRSTRRSIRHLGPLAALVVLAHDPLRAQSWGDPDLRYSSDGYAMTGSLPDDDNTPSGVACGPDGSCYTVSHSLVAGDRDFRIRHYSPTGTYSGQYSADFHLGGDFNDLAWAVAVQRDGKVVLVGEAQDSTTVGNMYRLAVARFELSGFALVLDSSFSGDGLVDVNFVGDASGVSVAIAPGGEIVIAGSYETATSAGLDVFVVRLDPFGEPDTTFDGNGIRTFGFDLGGAKNDIVSGVAVQADGKIVVVGSAQYLADDFDFAVARLTTTGALDSTFSGDGRRSVAFDLGGDKFDQANGVAIDRLQRIVVVGNADDASDASAPHAALVRLTTVGDLDSTFGIGGKHLDPDNGLGWALGLEFGWRGTIFYLVGHGDSGVLRAIDESGDVFTPFDGDGEVSFDPTTSTAALPWDFTMVGGQPLLAGWMDDGATGKQALAKYYYGPIFGDGFERGNISAWSGW